MGIMDKIRERVRRRPPGSDALMEGIQHGSRAFCGPKQLHVDLTNRCNLSCIACWHRSPLLRKEEVRPYWDSSYELPLERVLELVDQAAGLGVKKIIYSGGGDSLLYGDIFKVLEYTSSKGLDILLVSNLTMAGEETIGRIVESGITQLLVNLWAGSPEAYVATHPGSSEKTFFKVVDLMKAFVEMRRSPRDPELIISDVVCSRNCGDLENMVRLAVDTGACNIWFQTVDVEWESMRELLLDRVQIDRLLRALELVKERYGQTVDEYQGNILNFDDFIEKLTNSRASEGLYHTDVIDTMPCYMGWAGSRILANGDVVPCCKGDGHPLGNIFSDDFPKIWFSPRYDEFREKAKTLSKTNPYFSRINCGKVCDNWGFNRVIHERYRRYTERSS